MPNNPGRKHERSKERNSNSADQPKMPTVSPAVCIALAVACFYLSASPIWNAITVIWPS